MTDLQQFEKQDYLALETFRKNGQGVKTPVWFVRDDDTILVWTGAESGKVKRIHNNNRVNLAPSKVDGTPLGSWVEALAKEEKTAAAIASAQKLFAKKYGLQFKLYSGLGSLRKMDRTILVIAFPN